MPCPKAVTRCGSPSLNHAPERGLDVISAAYAGTSENTAETIIQHRKSNFPTSQPFQKHWRAQGKHRSGALAKLSPRVNKGRREFKLYLIEADSRQTHLFLMALFERFRRRSAQDAGGYEAARANYEEAIAETDAASRRAAYAITRSSEMLPDLREQTRLEIEEAYARTKLEAAQSKLEGLNTLRALYDQAAAKARNASRTGQPLPRPHAELVLGEIEAAKQVVATLSDEHSGLADRLDECRARLRTHDLELRRRFGIAETGL